MDAGDDTITVSVSAAHNMCFLNGWPEYRVIMRELIVNTSAARWDHRPCKKLLRDQLPLRATSQPEGNTKPRSGLSFPGG
jgi:hypothetical protein